MTREIEWLPEELMDEIVPPTRSTPEDWRQRVDGGWGLIVREDFEEEPRTRPLTDGEVVEFCWLEHHGSGVLTVAEDHWTIVPPMPSEANCVSAISAGVDGDVGDLVANMREDLVSGAIGMHDVRFYTWSDPLPFVFDAASGEFRAAGFDRVDPPLELESLGNG